MEGLQKAVMCCGCIMIEVCALGSRGLMVRVYLRHLWAEGYVLC